MNESVARAGARFYLTMLPTAGRLRLNAIDIATWMGSNARPRLGAAELYI